MKKTIKYLAYYSEADNEQKRHFTLAATNKINYISYALHNLGFAIQIISGSTTYDSKKCYSGSCRSLNEYTTLKDFFTAPWGNPLFKVLSILLANIQLFFELMKISSKECVIVYHSLGYMKVVQLTHFFKKYKLILEVEEVYADVVNDHKTREKEINFFKTADAYIFPTQLLDQAINVEKKPSVIIHGSYLVEPEKVCKHGSTKKDDEKDKIIHCVYAGTFDPRKGGAIAAAAAAEYLPSNYHMHILGFGTDQEIDNMKNEISEIDKISKASISYDGLLSGEAYIKFIQSCDIGLSTQNPQADFNATSFPSKILSYLANGLRVVSIRIPAIEKSDIADKIYFYDKQTPYDIAKAIECVDTTDDYDSRALIQTLSDKFELELKRVLDELSK